MCCPFGNKLVVVALVISDHIYDGVMSPFNLCMAFSSTYLFKLEFCRINKSCRNVYHYRLCILFRSKYPAVINFSTSCNY